MSIVLIEGKISERDWAKAQEDYQTYVKITADLSRDLVVIGGEYHADAEKLLLERGSQQTDVWGGGFNLETKAFEANALINLRPGQNDSLEILDPGIRQKFLELAARVFKSYV